VTSASTDTSPKPTLNDPRLPARFWNKVRLDEVNGCWLWQAASHSFGYGFYFLGKKRWLTHRLTYSTLVGDIPAGLEIDHLCRVPACCNPSHLEPVTHLENVRRGRGAEVASVLRSGMTHCRRGHEFAGDNLIVTRIGARSCRSCTNARQRSKYWADKLHVPGGRS
jgi:hypothetical protein